MVKKGFYIIGFFTLLLTAVACEKEEVKPVVQEDYFNTCTDHDDFRTKGAESNNGSNTNSGGGIVDPGGDPDFDGIVDPDEDEDFDQEDDGK